MQIRIKKDTKKRIILIYSYLKMNVLSIRNQYLLNNAVIMSRDEHMRTLTASRHPEPHKCTEQSGTVFLNRRKQNIIKHVHVVYVIHDAQSIYCWRNVIGYNTYYVEYISLVLSTCGHVFLISPCLRFVNIMTD